ncbi:MAG: alanine racemase, partial [Ilumatobacteraceae bacterium]
NGYGFGRMTLMPIAAELSDRIAVGTVYEAGDVPVDRVALVLTPHMGALDDDLARSAVLTVGNLDHVGALRGNGWTGAVAVKLQSSMRRYGTSIGDLEAVVAAIRSAGMTMDSYALHLPLGGMAADAVAEIDGWMPHLDVSCPVAISHVDGASYARVIEAHRRHTFRIRVGTALWHADKSLLQLTADVLEVRVVRTGVACGYRATPAPADGHVVMIAAGSAHGVRALDDGRSPFHFRRRRIDLLEPPHMHTSIAFVARKDDCPAIGDRVDVQRPLTTTTIDELEWTA